MADFQKAFALTLGNEGGYAYNVRPDGTCECVKYGLTLESLRRLGLRQGPIPTTPENVTEDDKLFIQSMTLDFVEPIFKKEYWDTLCLDKVGNDAVDQSGQDLANQLYDLAVNAGAPRTAEWLQESVGVTVDGVVGPATLAATNGYGSPEAVNMAVRAKAEAFYNVAEPAADRPQWLARLAKMGQLAGLPADS